MDEIDLLIEQILLNEGLLDKFKKKEQPKKKEDPKQEAIRDALRKIKYLLSQMKNYVLDKNYTCATPNDIIKNINEDGSNVVKMLTAFRISPLYVVSVNEGYIFLVEQALKYEVFESIDCEHEIDNYKRYASILKQSNGKCKAVANKVINYCSSKGIGGNIKEEAYKILQQDTIECKNTIDKYFKDL